MKTDIEYQIKYVYYSNTQRKILIAVAPSVTYFKILERSSTNLSVCRTRSRNTILGVNKLS